MHFISSTTILVPKISAPILSPHILARYSEIVRCSPSAGQTCWRHVGGPVVVTARSNEAGAHLSTKTRTAKLVRVPPATRSVSLMNLVLRGLANWIRCGGKRGSQEANRAGSPRSTAGCGRRLPCSSSGITAERSAHSAFNAKLSGQSCNVQLYMREPYMCDLQHDLWKKLFCSCAKSKTCTLTLINNN